MDVDGLDAYITLGSADSVPPFTEGDLEMTAEETKRTEDEKYSPPQGCERAAYEETYRSQTELIISGLKLLSLTHGGAVVAILALLGTFSGNCIEMPQLQFAIKLFAGGLALVFLCYLAAYFSQVSYLNWLTVKTPEQLRSHFIAFIVALVLVLLSLVLFAVASTDAANELTTFSCRAAKGAA